MTTVAIISLVRRQVSERVVGFKKTFPLATGPLWTVYTTPAMFVLLIREELQVMYDNKVL